MTSPKSASSISTQRYVVHLFDLYNRKYFGGTLPRYRITRRPTARQGDPNLLGMCDRGRRSIYIRRGLPRQLTLAVLAHEMAHIRQLGHGARFYAILLDLAAAGCTAARLALERESGCPRRQVVGAARWQRANYPRGEVIRRKRS